MNLRNANLNGVLIIIIIFIVTSTIVNFQEQIAKEINNISREVIYDKSFADAMKNLSNMIQYNEVLVVSAQEPFVTYFTNRRTHTPYGIKSKDELINYMVKNNYSYLLAFEGISEEENLIPLFSTKGIDELNESFQIIETFSTDFSKMRLYKLKKSV